MDELWEELSCEALELRLLCADAPLVVDVRTAPEVASRHIPGILWIPLSDLGARHRELDPGRETVLVCEHGIRSVAACRFLKEAGFRRLGNLTHGMSGWTGPVETGLRIEWKRAGG